MVEPRLDIGPIPGELRGLIDVAKAERQQMLAHERLATGIEPFVVTPHRRGGRPERFVVEIGQQCFHIGLGIPHQAVGHVVATTVRAPVVTAFAVNTCRTECRVAGNLLAQILAIGGPPPGQPIEIPEPDGEVLVEPHVSAELRPDLQKLIEAVASTNEPRC